MRIWKYAVSALFCAMKICFATNNANKLKEISQILGEAFEILSLKDIGCLEELPETHETLEENSHEKAEYVYNRYEIPVFADDTGLEVAALNGEPGVHSAHYSGSRDAEKNMQKLLTAMAGKEDRNAAFRTIITFIDPTGTYAFEGSVSGQITHAQKGDEGFGYDPVFIPEGYDQTFAELPASEKNAISHRKRAIEKLVDFLKSHQI